MAAEYINKNELIDFKMAQADTMGKVYIYKDEYIRIINHEKKELVEKLFNSGCIKKLINKRMIPNTRLSEYKINCEDDMIVASDAIRTNVTEEYWSYDMIKDAGLLVLSLEEILNLYGFGLNDVNIHNVLFDGCIPMWVDFGSFDYLNNQKWSYMKGYFYDNYVYPLKIINANSGMSGFISSFFSENWIGRNDFRQMKYLYHGIRNTKRIDRIKRLKEKYLPSKRTDTEKEIIKSCRDELGALQFGGSDTWGRYQDSMWDESSSGAMRFKDSIELLKTNIGGIDSMFEIGGNEGYFSFLCGEHRIAKYIVATDYSYEAINKAYRHFKENTGNYKIIPSIIDFVAIDDVRLSKFKADLVVANALTHHLLLSQKVTMKSLFHKMSICCEKYILIEYMPLGLWTPESGSAPMPEWYTLDNFCEAMSEVFEIIIKRQIEKNRIAIIGRKKG